MKHIFYKESLFQFLKSEFKTRKKKHGIFGAIVSLFQLLVFAIGNFYIKKEWNQVYKGIEQNILKFYPDVSFQYIGKKSSLISQFQNSGYKQIDFLFNKAHLAITKDSIYVFPYDSIDERFKLVYYNLLNEPFRIIYNPQIKKYKYSLVKTVPEFVSINLKNGTTEIVLQSPKLNKEFILEFDREIFIV
jgi:hypothetical protein